MNICTALFELPDFYPLPLLFPYISRRLWNLPFHFWTVSLSPLQIHPPPSLTNPKNHRPLSFPKPLIFPMPALHLPITLSNSFRIRAPINPLSRPRSHCPSSMGKIRRLSFCPVNANDCRFIACLLLMRFVIHDNIFSSI